MSSGYFGVAGNENLDAETGGLAGIASVVSNFSLIALVVAWESYLRSDGQSFKWKALAHLSLWPSIAAGLLATSKSTLLIPILLTATVAVINGKRPKTSHILICTLFLIFIAFPFVYFTRAATKILSVNSKTELYGEIASQLLSGKWLDLLDSGVFAESATGSLGRSMLSVLSTVIAKTGTDVSFLHGSTYLSEIGTLIPRFIWPEKPDLDFGNYIGRAYGFISYLDNITGISASQPGVLYLNFGTTGAFIGMAAWGIVASCFVFFFGRNTWYAALMVPAIVWQESGIAGLLYLPRSILMVAIFCILHQWTRKYINKIIDRTRHREEA